MRVRIYNWVHEWDEVGWECSQCGWRIPIRARIAHYLLRYRFFWEQP